jgi:pyridoxamine 5'-phosphate oxidase
MCLATVTKCGKPATRYVLLKQFDEHDGSLTWFTNYNSKKGEELAHNPSASLIFLWSDMDRSVRIDGKVEKVSSEISDAYFARRPRDSQIGSWASD